MCVRGRFSANFMWEKSGWPFVGVGCVETGCEWTVECCRSGGMEFGCVEVVFEL